MKGIAMKTIGMMAGMSWESSLEYYRIVNEAVKARLGGFNSAKCIMNSVNFAEIEAFQQKGKWKEAGQMMIEAARSIEKGGADFIIICTNTMHKLADDVQESIRIPLLHIADATAEKILSQGIRTVGLLGTRFTMEEDFYKGRLTDKYGLEVITPAENDGALIDAIIFNELCLGEIKGSSRKQYKTIMRSLVDSGAEGIILGCTEIGLLVQGDDSSVPLLDTTRIHAEAAVEFALEA